MTFRDVEKRLFRWFLKGLLLLAVLVVVGYWVLWGYTAYRERVLEREWTATVGQMRPFLESLLVQGKTEGAVRMGEILAPVGITFIPAVAPKDWVVTPWTFAQMPIHRYVERELEDPGTLVNPPPAEVEDFLASRAGVLEAVEAVLMAAPPPRWGEDGNRPWTTEPPRQLGLIHLGDWLAADALASEAKGDHERALRALEASHALAGALATRLELISQISAIALQQLQAGLVRKLDPVGPQWRGRLQEAYSGATLRKAFAYEAYLYRERGRQMAEVPFYRKTTRNERLFWRTYGRIWYRLSMADVAGRYLEEIRELDRLGPCAPDYLGTPGAVARTLPWWNSIGKMGMLNLGHFWERGIRLQVDAEFTARVLDLREARDRNGGAWPASVPGIGTSRCPGARFVYEVRDGAASLTFERQMKPTDRQGKITLPLRYVAPAPPHAAAHAGRGGKPGWLASGLSSADGGGEVGR